MSEIKNILEKLNGTKEAVILSEIENTYENIAAVQAKWYQQSKFTCPEGCGQCCYNFEPDLMEGEALYMAAWLLENQPDVAENVIQGNFPFPDNGKTCLFWNKDNPYHCSIYSGRAFICRLFGASGAHSKENKTVWKPCKFLPAEKLAGHKPPLAHRQYTQEETQEIFGTLPPVMSDLMEQAVSFTPDDENTKLIREILPDTLRKLKWILSLNEGSISSSTQA